MGRELSQKTDFSRTPDSGFSRIYFLSTLGYPIKQPNEMKNSSLELYATRFEDKERMFSGFSRNPDRFFRICLPCYADSGSGKPTPKNLLRNARGVESKHLMLLSTQTHNLQIYIIWVGGFCNRVQFSSGAINDPIVWKFASFLRDLEHFGVTVQFSSHPVVICVIFGRFRTFWCNSPIFIPPCGNLRHFWEIWNILV